MEGNSHMKLLICTQAVDENEPVLGFFVRWIEEFAKRCESVTVICLRAGEYSLPKNVRVHVLPTGGRLDRTFALVRLSYRFRGEYDTVFVHMNQEYVLAAGWLWKLLGKRVYLWRNHYAGSLLTDMAAAFCTKVFCTSRYSYTAKYKKTVFMPVGIDTERFSEDVRVERVPHSILWLARIAPSKRLEMLLDALEQLAGQGVDFSARIVGSPLPEHQVYYDALKARVQKNNLTSHVTFVPGVPNTETPDLYRAHQIFVNTSPSGMLDKTIFEAAACGCAVIASSEDWSDIVGAPMLDSSSGIRAQIALALSHQVSLAPTVAHAHSLPKLVQRLVEELSSESHDILSLS